MDEVLAPHLPINDQVDPCSGSVDTLEPCLGDRLEVLLLLLLYLASIGLGCCIPLLDIKSLHDLRVYLPGYPEDIGVIQLAQIDRGSGLCKDDRLRLVGVLLLLEDQLPGKIDIAPDLRLRSLHVHPRRGRSHVPPPSVAMLSAASFPDRNFMITFWFQSLLKSYIASYTLW